MLRRFQISANKSLDGVLDQLNSKRVTDAGPLDLIQDSNSDDDEPLLNQDGQHCYSPLRSSHDSRKQSDLPL